jgi:hypothetical protein
MMALFSMFDDQLQLEEACKYFCLRRKEELDLLRTHLKLKHNNTQTSQPTQTSKATKGPTFVAKKPLIMEPMQKCDDQNCMNLASKIT